MTAKLIAMYRTPADAGAFDRYYREQHLPIARRLPGLQGYEMTRGTVATLAGPSPYHLVATLSFASMDAVQTALASPQGEATAADLANFAMAGVEILIAESETL